MPHHNSHYYEFGPYRLDVGQRVLTRTGEAISLTPKATDILTLLVANAGQIMAKDELLKQVWPDTFVEESNLTQNIFLLRRVLGDERPAPRYIETVVRRGYRFVANVRVVGGPGDRGGSNTDQNPARPGESQRSIFSHATIVDDASARPSVAVLPFLNATGDHDSEYLADGLTDNIVNNLSRVAKLRVMSRSAVFRYKRKKELDPRTVGRELNVNAVLVGKLTARPQGLIITVELVEVTTGWQLWGDSFDCPLNDLLDIQDVITRQLLTALKLDLTGEEEKRITARYTESAAAYQSYLEARYHWSKYTRQGIEKAITHFRQAIELDPNYALAYAGIIDCYLRLATNYLPPEEENNRLAPETPKIEHNGASLDPAKGPDDSEINPARSANVKLRFEWDWKTAERELQRASALKTGYPSAHQWYAAYKIAKDLFERSKRLYDEDSSHPDWNLPDQVLLGEPTTAEQLHVLCAIAREQIRIANFEAAELILRPWYPQKNWPDVASLTTHEAADLLLTLGTLIGCVGGSRRMRNGQKRAEAFLNGAIALFEHVRSTSQSGEAQAELARCYHRQGLFDLARETFDTAISVLPANQTELKTVCLVFLGNLERDSGRLMDSLMILRQAKKLQIPGRLVTGRCELELATTLKELAVSENEPTYNDEALLNYANALREAEGIGNHRLAAVVENNLGFLLLSLGSSEESERHLLRARRFFEAISDTIRRAQVNETLTRLYVATSQYCLAKECIEDALQTLEQTDAEAILSEALTTSGIVSSRLGHFGQAQKRFEEGLKVAERCGDREGARRALVTKFEETGIGLQRDELRQLLQKLRQLSSINEPSSLSYRVEETITRIETALQEPTDVT